MSDPRPFIDEFLLRPTFLSYFVGLIFGVVDMIFASSARKRGLVFSNVLRKKVFSTVNSTCAKLYYRFSRFLLQVKSCTFCLFKQRYRSFFGNHVRFVFSTSFSCLFGKPLQSCLGPTTACEDDAQSCNSFSCKHLK